MDNVYVGSFGAIKSPLDIRDYRLKHKVVRAQVFPDEFELPLCAVKNQMQTGSCVAFSLSEVVEYFHRLQHSEDVVMSTGFIYGNRTNCLHKGSGMYVRSALGNLMSDGDVPNSYFDCNVEVPEAITRYEEVAKSLCDIAYPNRISTYFRVYTSAEIKTALMKYGPVVFAMEWFSDIKVGKNGIIQSSYNKNNSCGGHCMVIYGWDENGWKIRNSWGILWGKNGNAILPYDAPITESWGISDNIVDDLKKPYRTWIGKKWAKLVNSITRFIQQFVTKIY